MTSSQIRKRKVDAPPVLALGAMNFGKRTPAAESERIVRRALERGIRWFDTANVYSGAESERILGRALGRDSGSVTLSSKVGAGPVGGIPGTYRYGDAPTTGSRFDGNTMYNRP